MAKLVDGDTKFVIKGSLIILTVKCLGIGAQFIQTLVVVRYFGLEANGLLALFISLIRGFGLLTVFGLDNFTLRKASTITDAGQLQREFNKWGSEYVLAITISYFLSVLAFTVVYFWTGINVLWWLVCVTLLPFAFLKIFSFYSRGVMQLFRYAFIEFALLNVIFLIILVVSTGIFELEVTSSFLTKAFASGIFVAATCFVFFMLKVDLSFNTRLFIRQIGATVSEFKSFLSRAFLLLRRSYHFLLSNATIVLTTALISVVITTQLSEQSLGIYDVVLKISQLTAIPLMGINGALAPKIAAYFHNRQFGMLRKQVYICTLLSSALTFIIAAILLSFYRDLVGFVDSSLKGNFLLFVLLILAQIINVVTGPVGYILQMTRQERVFNKIVVLASLIYLIASYFLLDKVGIDAVGYTYVFFIAFTNITASYFVYAKFRFIPFMAFWELLWRKQ